jgi:hypothetical protein
MSDGAQTERVSLTNFLIRDTAECIIGILAVQVNDELGKFMISTKQVYRVLWEWLDKGERRDEYGALPKAFHPIIAEKSR